MRLPITRHRPHFGSTDIRLSQQEQCSIDRPFDGMVVMSVVVDDSRHVSISYFKGQWAVIDQSIDGHHLGWEAESHAWHRALLFFYRRLRALGLY